MDVSGTRIRCIAVPFLECSNRIGIYVIYIYIYMCVSCPTIVDHHPWPMTDLFQTFCFYIYNTCITFYIWISGRSFVCLMYFQQKYKFLLLLLSLVLVLLLSMNRLTCQTRDDVSFLVPFPSWIEWPDRAHGSCRTGTQWTSSTDRYGGVFFYDDLSSPRCDDDILPIRYGKVLPLYYIYIVLQSHFVPTSISVTTVCGGMC